MKTTTASLFLLFILSITQSSFLFGVANAAGDAMLDGNGDERRSDFDYGNPVVFSNVNPSDGVVRVSSDVRVKFEGPRDRLCLTSTVWKVEGEGESWGKRWVELGGSEGEAAGCDTVENWFKIERASIDGTYKFKYCPSVCESSATSCNEIEKDEDSDGQVRLAVSDGTGYP
ncbi:hypothetical protein V6N12_028144 [Hibiscus sabdariffa]|uniref:Proteinase inhibitor I3, Kunitz legume n=1 Tax=Hibiscus sabdariffa TaxID=183260 RepID=A0ABR2F526_9ROSI